MPEARALLPHSTTTTPISARAWTIGVAGVGSGVAALGGLYPQFDGGKVRILFWLSTTVFGSLLAFLALRASTRTRAVVATFLLGAAFGWANAFFGALVAFQPNPSDIGVVLLFAGAFGVPTGLLYGVPLSLLLGPAFRGIRSASLDGADAAKSWASLWALVVGLSPLPLMTSFDVSLTPMLPALAVSALGLAALVVHARRLFARRAWMARVRAGKEPLLRIRPASPEDMSELVLLADGASVVELLPTAAAVDGVYRSGALGVPLAVVADGR